MPVRESTGGASVGDAQREAAADAFRLFARSYLPGAGLGFFGLFGCVGVPLQALALLAAFQRLLALRRCRSEVRAPSIASIAALHACQRATVAEVVLGTLALGAGIGSAPVAVHLGLVGLWFGTALLGACAGALAVDQAAGRFSPETVPAMRGVPWLFGSAGAHAAAALIGVLASGGLPGIAAVSWLAVPLVLAAGGAWAWGSLAIAFAGSSVAGDIGMPRKAPRAREAAPADTDAAAGTAARPVARTPPPDDEPIPY
jgi:hypothetical protein